MAHDNFVTAGVIDERFESDPIIAITDDDRPLMTNETSTSSAVLLQNDEGLGDFAPVTEFTSDDGVVEGASVWLHIVE